MTHSYRMATIALLAFAAAACQAVVIETPSESPVSPPATDAPTAPRPSLDYQPTTSPSPSVGVESPAVVVPSVLDLSLHCTGDMLSSVIDYADEAAGGADILAATRALPGVRPTDVVVVTGTATWVVRDGSAIWTGTWFPGRSGFLLGGFTSCATAGIATND
jgi:hypothetical protein